MELLEFVCIKIGAASCLLVQDIVDFFKKRDEGLTSRLQKNLLGTTAVRHTRYKRRMRCRLCKIMRDYARLCEIMRDYARLCESTQIYAILASVYEAPFCARYASSHTKTNCDDVSASPEISARHKRHSPHIFVIQLPM